MIKLDILLINILVILTDRALLNSLWVLETENTDINWYVKLNGSFYIVCRGENTALSWLVYLN